MFNVQEVLESLKAYPFWQSKNNIEKAYGPSPSIFILQTMFPLVPKWHSERNTGFAGTGVAQAHHRQPHLSEVGPMFSIVEECTRTRQLEPIQLQTKTETASVY